MVSIGSSFLKYVGREIDPYTAKATMEYKGVTGSGIFKFNDRGEVVEFKANRPRAVGDHFELTPGAYI